MLKKTIIFIINLVLFSQINVSKAEDIASLCLKKDNDLKCNDDLNYTLSQEAKNSFISQHTNAVCSACPLDYEVWSCTVKEKTGDFIPIEIYDLDIKTNDERLKGCIKFPSCYDLGYAFSSAEVEKISKDFSCSACPYDGSKWACAKGNDLYKPASNTNNNAHN